MLVVDVDVVVVVFVAVVFVVVVALRFLAARLWLCVYVSITQSQGVMLRKEKNNKNIFRKQK